MTVGERLPEVWHGPFRRRVRGHIVMEDSGVPRSMTMNTYSVRNVAVTTTKKSHAAITRAWLRTKSPPPLLWIGRANRSTGAQVLSDCARRYPNAELQLQFVGKLFRTPRSHSRLPSRIS